MNFLSDTWEETGSDFDSFKETLKAVEKNTVVKQVNMNDVYFLSVSDIGTGRIAVPLHSDEFWKKTKCSLSIKKYDFDGSAYEMKGYDETVVSEAIANGLFMMTSEKRLGPAKIREALDVGGYIPVSEKAMNTISSRISCGGYGFMAERLIRDLAISKKFCKPVPVSAIMRIDENTGLKKVFAVMSNKYTIIPQSLIVDIIDKVIDEAKKDLGEASCAEWIINHSLTRIYIEFPDAGKEFMDTYELPEEMIPGIMIETSDIGDCALRIRGYFRMETSNTISYMGDEYSRIHSGELDTNEILNAAKDKIFPKYTEYPEKLAKLMMIDLTDDTMTPSQKVKTMSSIYRKVSRAIGLVKAIQKKREKTIIDQLIDAINPGVNYTAYDVAMTFLTLATCIETENKAVVEAIAKTAPEVLNYNFTDDKETEELLVA